MFPTFRVCFGLALILFLSGIPGAAEIPDPVDDDPDGVEESTAPLFLRPPFHRLTLTSLYNNKSFDILPVEFPDGVRPEILPRTGELPIRFVDNPTKEYYVKWNDVERIELFSELVQQEYRKRLTALSEQVLAFSSDRGSADAAGEDQEHLTTRFELLFDYLCFLEDYRSELPELPESYQRFLYEEAIYRIKLKAFPTGLTRFESLHRENKLFPGLEQAWSDAVDTAMEQEIESGRFVYARRILERFREFYPEHPLVGRWETRLIEETRRLCGLSQSAFEEKDYLAAHRHCEAAFRIMPTLEELVAWKKRLQAAAPRIDIAVNVPFSPDDRRAGELLPDWGIERTRPLVRRMLGSFARPSFEGGVYRFPTGEWTKTDAPREGRWTFDAKYAVDAYDAAETILRLLEPVHGNESDSARFPVSESARQLVASLEISAPNTLTVRWRRAFPLPEALFAVPVLRAARFEIPAPIPATGSGSVEKTGPKSTVWADGPYAVQLREPLRNGFQRRDAKSGDSESNSASGPAVVFEHTVFRGDEAITRLLAGQIDMIDRLPPWETERLRRNQDFVLGRYMSPSLYFIVPNPNKPLTADRTFRRALLYGLNRSGLLAKLLPAGGQGAVLSAPFIRGGSLSDPLGYAYDSSILPRPYEPKLAIALALSALDQIRKNNPEWAEAGAIPELVLARPAHQTAEYAALMIRRQWAAIGIAVRIVEYRDPEPIGRSDDVDFWLVDRNVREPLLDAERIFGHGGLHGKPGPYMELALERLRLAEDWPTAGERLREIHRLCFEETTVLPLWQIPEHYIHRLDIQGVAGNDPAAGIVHLYENLPQWTVP